MRFRDKLVSDLKREGFECVGIRGDMELWAKSDDPDDVRLIPANPPMPESVRKALIEYLEENWDKPIPPSPGEAEE